MNEVQMCNHIWHIDTVEYHVGMRDDSHGLNKDQIYDCFLTGYRFPRVDLVRGGSDACDLETPPIGL